jgi:cysteine desulfurase/selenocysteine lyase
LKKNIKADFPIFEQYPDLCYLDNAATTMMPKSVVNRITQFYTSEKANIHRGGYMLSNQATSNYESVRHKVAAYLHAESDRCIAFTRGTTESINIVARSLASGLSEKNNLVTTLAEHHANFLPWQQICEESGAELRVANLTKEGILDVDHLASLIDHNSRIVAVNHVSNVTGAINDIAKIVSLAHDQDIPVLIDAAQSAFLHTLDPEQVPYDFLTFSGHKLLGPFGIGVLYTSPRYQDMIKPLNVGGGMVYTVDKENTYYKPYPQLIEAGTPDVAGAIGLGAAIDYINQLDKGSVAAQLQELSVYAYQSLSQIDQLQFVGRPDEKSPIFAFNLEGIHPHDAATFFDKDQIALRAGLHCAQPLHQRFNLPASIRISLSIYNEQKDIDRLIVSTKELVDFWS